jgi:hypothetical protein
MKSQPCVDTSKNGAVISGRRYSLLFIESDFASTAIPLVYKICRSHVKEIITAVFLFTCVVPVLPSTMKRDSFYTLLCFLLSLQEKYSVRGEVHEGVVSETRTYV